MRKKHIMVADDEINTRFALSLIFRKAGYEVTTVSGGHEALLKIIELVQSSNTPDLLVLDIQMPGLTGFELIDEINKRNVILPILIISGYKYQELVRNMTSHVCIGYLEKPFEPDDLLYQVELVFEKFSRLKGICVGNFLRNT